VNTEITDNHARLAGWIFYDGECHLCLAWAKRLRAALSTGQLDLLPLQSPDAMHRLGATGPAPLKVMRLLLADGRNLGGADAIVEIARCIWWAWPLWAMSRLPGAMPVLRAGYRSLAARRHCANGICLMPHRTKSLNRITVAGKGQNKQRHRHAAFFELP
jgi:predicted DCC family thiol-disulfide oxidoreductase YuxK